MPAPTPTKLAPATIKRQLAKIHGRRIALGKEYAERQHVIDVDLDALRQRCPHKWKHLSDTAVGPSHEYCEICEVYK